MAEITAAAVKELRDRTGAGMMDCKKALHESDGDVDKAVEYLRKQGMAAVEKRAGRDATDGLIVSYIHPGSRIGVLVEVNCETDFVARTDDFQQFGRDVAISWFLSWLERRGGKGRALGSGEVKFTGQVLPNAKKITYLINLKRVIMRKLVMGIADAKMQVDGRIIYEANDLKVGLFKTTENF